MFKVGDLCYLDTFAGLVPCKVTGILPLLGFEVKLTAARGAYKAGEVLFRHLGAEARTLVHRSSVHVRSGHYVIQEPVA